MRIYNAKNSQVDLPIAGNTRVTIPAHSVSKDVMPSDEFLTMIAQTFEAHELALIVAGPYEINMCAKNPACTPLIVQSLDEAIERFNGPKPGVETVEKEYAEIADEKLKPVEETVEEEPAQFHEEKIEEEVSEVVDAEPAPESVEEDEEEVEATVVPEEEAPAVKPNKKNKKGKKH